MMDVSDWPCKLGMVICLPAIEGLDGKKDEEEEDGEKAASNTEVISFAYELGCVFNKLFAAVIKFSRQVEQWKIR